jgi:fatty acid desaturase
MTATSRRHDGSDPGGAVRAAGTMLPDPALLTDGLPTERLGPGGRPKGALRAELYRIPNLANVGHVAGVWIQSVGLLWLVAWWGHPVGWLLAFPLMGRSFARFSILAHEAAHRLLFSNRTWNDRVGAWLVAYPAFVPLDIYRRGHMAHHKEEFGPNEPDLGLYSGYPITTASWHRKLRRDATGNSGWKNLKGLLNAIRSATARPVAVPILVWQVVLVGLLWAVTGHWWAYPLFWLAPWMTAWRVLNRLRSVAEHGGLQASPDRRLTTHHVRQGVWARFWMVPFNTGWHLAHHVDIGVPFQHLPRLQRELEAAGYVQPGLAWPSYTALWRHAHSRPTPTDG